MIEKLIHSIRRKVLDSSKSKARLRELLNTRFRRSQRLISRVFFGKNLDVLAIVNDTDKNTRHNYIQHYQRLLAPYRSKHVRLLEIGIGGYSNPLYGGGSLRMWRTYFPRGRIFGIDIHDKRPHDEAQIRTFRGSQIDLQFLESVVSETGPLNIIIDYGSHVCEHVITSFEFLFPRLAKGGLYVIEDVQTSYWSDFGGNDEEPDHPETIVGFFKGLVHGLNHAERPSRPAAPSYYSQNIVSISFFHNLIAVAKG